MSTHTVRQQFDTQCRIASITAKFYGIVLDVVIVRSPGHNTRISIIGNAISRAAYDIWKADGSQVRLLRIYGPDGEIQNKEPYETNQRDGVPPNQ